MSALSETFEKIKADLINEQKKLDAQLTKIDADIAEQTDLRREALRQGDLSENAEYKSATEAIERLSTEKFKLDKKVAAYESFMELLKHKTKSSSFADITSVVHVTYRVGKEGVLKDDTFMLVPSAIGDLSIKALSDKSMAGKRLLGCKAGDEFNIYVKDKVFYTVKEVY